MSTQENFIKEWIADRVRENRYFDSEHMVRYMTCRMFSVAEIRQVLLSGHILEIHSHPLRCDGYLFLGYPAGRPIHVMCTKDNDENLIVLYAYRPGLPIWKNEKIRMTSQLQIMDQNNLRKCFFCNGQIEPITVGNFDFRWEGGLYVIKKVPAGLCVQCGEKYISAETSKKLVAKLEADAVDGLEEVRVFHYDEK